MSFDCDERSVEATRALWERTRRPESWTVRSGSILDSDFLGALGRYDIVYAWAILHHTGSMWQAIENAFALVAPHGTLFISIYKKGP